MLEGVHDAVLALDFVGRLGDESAGGLFAHDEFAGVGGGDLVGWVGLAEAKLFFVGLDAEREEGRGRTYLLEIDGEFYLGHIFAEEFAKRGLVDGLTNSAGHFGC